MILISKTFEEITPESAEDGDYSDKGFVYENAEFTFKELVRELRDYSESSSRPCTGSRFDWASTGWGTTDYATGTERNESLHFSRTNNPRAEKYWTKALRVAGLA